MIAQGASATVGLTSVPTITGARTAILLRSFLIAIPQLLASIGSTDGIDALPHRLM